MAGTTVSTRFMVISDTHDLEYADAVRIFRDLPKVDVLMHCGDLTQCGGLNSYKKALKIFSLVKADLKLVIAGNHDLELDEEYWKNNLQEGDEAEEHDDAMTFWDVDAAEAGVTYLDEGTHQFDLPNGASFTLYASPWQPAFGDFAFNYKHTDDRFNLQKDCIPGATSVAENSIPSFPGVDVMMTHGPPKGINDECRDGSVGCPNLLHALKRSRPLLHCFGHIHEGYGASTLEWAPGTRDVKVAPNATTGDVTTYSGEFGYNTLAINASMMTGAHKPDNAPWIVDVPLPKAANQCAI